eukprot:TRINITY_DN1045_c0_g5_i2.p1 TRINITY_DN1045_c0_g5~~TRINITY_DN1045_c0_g5_i2.p1  ORF type:complete len:350 (+),score=102.88 TRINITY_DN1045_c0_g5_i2:715-1764(+)
MIRDYPGYVIPPVPTKKLMGNTDPSLIQERKGELQMFLNAVLKHPLLKNYELFFKFVSASSKEWEDRSKLIGKLVIPRDPSQYETVEGQAKILYSDHTATYCDNLQLSMKTLKDLYHELKTTNKSIATTYEQLAQSLTKAGLIYQRIGAIYTSLDSGSCGELFLSMYDGHARLGEVYRKLRENCLSQLVEFFSFYGHEIAAVEELLAKRKSTGESIDSTEKKLLKKKEQKFEAKNTATWELESSALANIGALLTDKNLAFQEMFPKESLELRKMKMFYGYYTNKIAEEFDKMVGRNEHVYKAQLEKIISFSCESELELSQIWKDTMERMKKVGLSSAGNAETATQLTAQ